jgi:hypothetical protein
MSDRIHACIDGDLAPDDLRPEERAALAEMEEVVGSVVGHLRSLPAPDLTAAVMRSLPPRAAPAAEPALAHPAAPPAWRRLADWLWQPRPVRIAFRPAYGLAGAMLAAFAVVQVPRPGGPATQPPVLVASRGAGAPTVYVQFRLEAPDARDVAIAGTFTGWEPRAVLRETEPGVWSALIPLRPGVHDYAFVVDGEEWVADPNAMHVADSFGGTNSRISLPPPGSA